MKTQVFELKSSRQLFQFNEDDLKELNNKLMDGWKVQETQRQPISAQDHHARGSVLFILTLDES